MPPLSSSLLAALEREALVIAPTAMAAAGLRHTYDQLQRTAGLTVWQPANVLSWQQWLGSLWTGLVLSGDETRLLLNTAQEELLWREIVLPTLDAANTASAPGFAQLARSAFALAAGYNVTGRLAASAGTEDTEQFARWAAEFTRTCGRHAYLPAARLAAALLEHLARLAFPLPAELHLTGFFADLPPADADLLDALRRAGTRIVDHPHSAAPPATRLTLRAANEAEELRAIAHWLRNFLDNHIQAHGPAELPAIHVVLATPRPDLAAIDSIFREILAPELNLITTDPSSAPWQFAGGRPLAGQPIVATLLRLLRGLIRPLPVDDVTALLLSPYLGPGRDRDAAAQFDAWSLRERPPLRPELTFRDLHRLAQQSPYGQSSLGWLRPLLAFTRDEGDLAAPRTYAAWTVFIRALARAVGWPGEQALAPQEFAATRACDHLLDSITTLDFTGRRVPFADALAALEHQAETAAVALPGHAPIQILSAAEAAAVPCDVLIVAQATDTNWPPAARPHPLLPWPLQASAGMPGAHPAADAARAERLNDALLSKPAHVLLSYAADANDAPQRLAPALTHLAQSPGVPWRAITAADLIPASVPVIIAEQVVDDVPLPSLPGPQVSGGATVLQLQAACGFRAFAELRLHSTGPKTPELGFDAGRVGSLLHHALDVFWRSVQSQTALLSLSDEQLDENLVTAVGAAFNKIPFSDDPWDKAYRALQMQRLFDLLKSWMSFETQRTPFIVLDREQERHLTVGPLELNLRVDRIDSVEEGEGAVLIDYKTGSSARPSAWESERPEEPQLPLYTLLPNAANLRGLAFARLRKGQLGWSGIQAEPGLLGKSKLEPEIAELVEEWRRVLTGLAEQFAAGDHSVNPKSYPLTCTYCGQRFLCRLDPNTLLAGSADTEEEVDTEEEATHG